MIEWVAHAGHSGIIFLGFAVLGALPTLAVVWNVELVRALKGELPARGIVVASWAMRAGAVVLALGAVSQCLMLATAASHRERSLAAMQTVPGAHLLFIGGAVHSNEAQNEMAKVVNPWVVKHAKEGRVLLADLQDGPGGALLYVNQRYLDAHPLLLADGRDVRDLMVPGQVVALIPSHRWEEREVLLPELQLDVDFRAGGGEAVSLAVFQVESGNQLPFFGIPSETEALGEAGMFGNRQGTWVEDPIVLVTRDDEYHSYLSAASQGRAFFFDADQLVHEIKADPVLAGYVTSLTPVETRAAHHAVEALVRFRLALAKAGIAGVIALVAGLSLAVSHSKLRGQRIFVRHLHGGSAIGSYRMLLLAETVLVLGALVWLPWQVMQQRAEFDALAEATGGGLGLGPPPELQLGDLVPGMLVVLVVSGGMAVTLWQIHRRIIRKGISEA
ncbi:MAG: hypothetical protein Q4D96_04965 [Propionibacteriaceae bacterium]|nr:hypothetical protein [Propionibacteriaceae bacterium]